MTFSTPTIRSDNGKAALMVRNLCNHLLDLNMNMLDNRNITSKHFGYKDLHLNKAGSTCLAKNIIHKVTEIVMVFGTLKWISSKVRVSSNIYQPSISCNSLNSNYVMSSKSFTIDEMISTKTLSITDVTKNSVNSKSLNNS